jgi:hypothetical protein
VEKQMFFNISELTRQSKGNPEIMLKMLENYYFKRIPKNDYDKRFHARSSLAGKSFILNPEKLFSIKVDNSYKVQYLILAAKRDRLFYDQYGIDYLDLSFYPDLNIAAIRNNPLMTVSDNKIHFNI